MPSRLSYFYQILLLGSAFVLASCGDNRQPKRISDDDLAEYISAHKIGEMSIGSDYWLEKKVGGTLNTWGKVSLVFGYVDNFQPCEELAVYWENTYSGVEYRCTPANHYETRVR